MVHRDRPGDGCPLPDIAMSIRRQQLKRERYQRKQRQCTYTDDQGMRCAHEGRACELPDYDSGHVDIEYVCGEHAARMGYCPGCGQFWGGVGSFEMTGLCDNCRHEAEADNWHDEDNDGYWEDPNQAVAI